MLLVIGTFTIPPERLSIAIPVMERMVRESRQEEGCEEYVYAQDLLLPGLIHVKELWHTQHALDAHLTSPHLAEWRSSWAALEIANRNLRKYEVGESQMT